MVRKEPQTIVEAYSVPELAQSPYTNIGLSLLYTGDCVMLYTAIAIRVYLPSYRHVYSC